MWISYIHNWRTLRTCTLPCVSMHVVPSLDPRTCLETGNLQFRPPTWVSVNMMCRNIINGTMNRRYQYNQQLWFMPIPDFGIVQTLFFISEDSCTWVVRGAGPRLRSGFAALLVYLCDLAHHRNYWALVLCLRIANHRPQQCLLGIL